MKSGIRIAGLVVLAGAIIGVGVYGCKKEEPQKEDVPPTESIEQIGQAMQEFLKKYTPPKEPTVQEAPREPTHKLPGLAVVTQPVDKKALSEKVERLIKQIESPIAEKRIIAAQARR